MITVELVKIVNTSPESKSHGKILKISQGDTPCSRNGGWQIFRFVKKDLKITKSIHNIHNTSHVVDFESIDLEHDVGLRSEF
jgi:hypothetical protein